MNIHVANRLEGIGEYYFSTKLREIEEMNRDGAPVINLGIGSPDLPPHPEVISELQQQAARADVHSYQSYKGAEVLRKAFSRWYQQWYGVTLNPSTEILPLIGSKEGIMHVCMTYLNKGDVAMIPNPGYPTYQSAVKLSGAKCIAYKLKEKNNWQIDFDTLEKKVRGSGKVKLMFVNFPQMPTGSVASKDVFRQLVAFAKKYKILLCHDNPYSFILNDNPVSLLSVDGAMEVALELNSLSKSHNMAGWRVGMIAGAAERIEEILRFKSNMDSGMFLPVQLAAAKALSLQQDWFDNINEVYRKRKEKAFELLRMLRCNYSHQQSGLFVWARIPEEYSNGYELSDEVLRNSRVFITPGGIFGSAGENYIRVSLCATEDKFNLAIERMAASLKTESEQAINSIP
jgi:aspartate/methionine/tyrosine aminotransferase